MNSLKELLPYKEIIKDNILEIYNQATLQEHSEGRGWYSSALSFCEEVSKDVKLPIMNIAGLVAAISPQTEWSINKEWTKLYFKGNYKQNGVQNEKCHKIKKAKSFSEIMGILHGPKTKNFFGSILYPEDKHFVVIDSHMLKVLSGLYIDTCTPYQYNKLKTIFKEVSTELNTTPASLQSVCWLTYKRVKPKYYKAKKYEQ